MFELFCKISFFLFMLVMYAYVTSAGEVVTIILAYFLCVFSYYNFQTIKTTIDDLLNYIKNHGLSKFTLNPPQASNYAATKKYHKVNNSVNVSSIKNKIYVPYCRNNNVYSNNTPAVFNCKFNNLVLNGDLQTSMMRNGLSVEKNKIRDKINLPMHNMNMIKGYSNSSAARFRNNSQSGHNPFISSKKHNNCLDMETYMNVRSPGFTGRIVDKALESASYHIKYPAVKQISAYRFDKSTLRNFSKIPRMSSSPLVRIAPPEPISIHLLNDIEKKLDMNEAKEQNFLHGLKDSRKRNYSQEGGNEKSSGTAKKSRKNSIRNFTISQYKRSLEDKSSDILEDGKKRCDNYTREEPPKMIVYAPSLALAPNGTSNTYSKKRKSSKTDKSKNECSESIEKYRRVDKSAIETSRKEYLNETTPKNCDLKSYDYPVKESKPVHTPHQGLKQAQNESMVDGNIEYVQVASGKILNRTNHVYRRKFNITKIDPISVIASEPEIVGKITDADDVALREHLLQNLLNHIERKDHKDEKVIFYENSIIEEVSQQNSPYDEPPQQVPNPIFTDNIVPNANKIEKSDITNDESKKSAINFANFASNKTATCGIIHSTPITSDVDSHKSYTKNSIRGVNHVVTSNTFGSAPSLASVTNGSSIADSGYDSPSVEASINTSLPSFNQSFPFTKNIAFAPSNGFDGKILQPSPASTSSFRSGDSNFFNPVNTSFSSSNSSKLMPQIGNKNMNCNFGANTSGSSHTFGNNNGRTSLLSEPSFKSIASGSGGNFSVFGNGHFDIDTSRRFSIGAGDHSSLGNHANRNGWESR